MIKKHFVGLLQGAALAVFAACLAVTALAAQAPQAAVDLADGEYTVDVAMEGGSGRSGIASPATLIVRDGCAYARVEWSSSNYDYMKVGGEKYLPVNEDGPSAFEIPVPAFDEPVPVIADTTAMSTPHEVEYALTFAAASLAPKKTAAQTAVQIAAPTAILIAALSAAVFWKGKKRRNGKK